MSKINELYKDIRVITQKLSELALLKANNFPIIKDSEVVWENYS
jgi:hypothetical protein